MIRPRTALLALAPVLLHALAREADRGLGLVLRAELEPQNLLVEVGRAMGADAAGAVVRVALWLVVGVAAWLGLAGWRRRREGTAWAPALAGEAGFFAPLLLRPAVTLVALLTVATRASYPYGFTLPVALTQDWAIGQDAAVLAALVAWRLPAFRFPAPRAVEVFALAFLTYALLVPDWAWRWEGHPGNEPKYLRQAVALGHGLTFDAEGVSAAMEDLPTRPLLESAAAAVGTLGRESWSMAAALARGEAGREAIRAQRITRQTIRGKEGGVYYVLAPGPSLMLAPALRIDRAINLARGRPGRVSVSVLVWCALAALLVMALFLLVRDATGRPGLAAVLAFGFAVVPPFLFYFFQFYPEMVGALVMAVAFRTLALRPEGLRRHPWLFGGMLATLPWLHQKFLPVWLALVATALFVGWRPSARRPATLSPLSFRGAPAATGDEGSAGVADSSGPVQPMSLGMTRPAWRWAMGLVVPTLLGLYLTALYNFAITGSVRPDALFLAWGPGGVTSARVGQGVLGLLLDARYGILPYAPILVLAAAGLALGGARRFAVVMPAAAVYYLTVASADNWAGAVCNMGRYFMPVAPLAVALVGIAIDRALSSRVPTRVERGSPWAMTCRAERFPGTPAARRLPLGKAPVKACCSSAGTSIVSRPEGSAGARAETADPSSPDSNGAPRDDESLLEATGALPVCARDDSATRGAVALVLVLAAWTGLLALALWRDPHAANDSALLLAKSAYADGHQYIPGLFIRRWSDGAPGLWARVVVWLAGLGAVAWWLKRVATSLRCGRGGRGSSPIATMPQRGSSPIATMPRRGSSPIATMPRRGSSPIATMPRRGNSPIATMPRRGNSPIATIATVAGLVLAAGLFLERWPGRRTAPAFGGAMPVTPAPPDTAPTTGAPAALFPSGAAPATTLAAPPLLFVSGAASVRGDEAILGPGVVELLLRAPLPASSLRVTVGGRGSVLRATGLPPLVLRPTGGLLDLPLVPYHEVRGREGRRVAFSRTSLTLEGEAVLRLGEEEVAPPEGGGPPGEAEGEMEPEPGGDR